MADGHEHRTRSTEHGALADHAYIHHMIIVTLRIMIVRMGYGRRDRGPRTHQQRGHQDQYTPRTTHDRRMEDVERREERGVFNEQPAASQIRDQAAAAGVADGTQWLVARGTGQHQHMGAGWWLAVVSGVGSCDWW